MKKIIIIILFAFSCFSAFAQPSKQQLNLLHYDYGRRLRFGFSLGLNVFDFNTSNTFSNVVIDGMSHRVRADVTTQRRGFDINAIIDYRIKRQWNIRCLPGISFGSRDLDFFDDNTNELLHKMKMESNYMEIPVHLKFSTKRYSNTKAYVFAGANTRYNLSSGADTKRGVFFGINNTELFGEFGFGFEFYLVYFKFSVEAKFSTGLTNVLTKGPTEGYEEFYNIVDKLRSNMFMLKFHFE